MMLIFLLPAKYWQVKEGRQGRPAAEVGLNEATREREQSRNSMNTKKGKGKEKASRVGREGIKR
jgi:hypothetical protein